MDQQNQPQTPSSEGSNLPVGKAQGLGWIWVAVIVVIVAGVLYVTQKKAPAGDESETDQSQEEAPVVKDIPVTPTLVNAPKAVPTGSIFGLSWTVEAAEQTYASETGIAWDTASHRAAFGTDTPPATSAYPNITKGHTADLFAVPGEFEDNLKLDEDAAGAIYVRVFATVAGKTYWSDEISIPIKQKNTTGGGS